MDANAIFGFWMLIFGIVDVWLITLDVTARFDFVFQHIKLGSLDDMWMKFFKYIFFKNSSDTSS